MARLSDQEVDDIARQVLEKMAGAPSGKHRRAHLADGVARGALERRAARGRVPFGRRVRPRSRRARRRCSRRWGMIKRREIIQAMRDAMTKHGEELARMAHEETGLGRVDSKIIKNRLVTLKTPGPEELESVAWTGDNGLTLVERAPFGVIGAITPTTNPTSTIICNSIGMLSAGNAVVFNVHPRRHPGVALQHRPVERRDRLGRWSAEPGNVGRSPDDRDGAGGEAKGVRLLGGTGGPGVVKAAMNSGKRAICAGPGNPPVVVDETCDIGKAGADIVTGASLDTT